MEGVAPGVAGPVLDDGVAWAELDRRAVVQFDDHPAGQDVLEVDRDGGVHAGIVRLVVIEQPRQRRLEVGERGSHVDPLGRRRRRGGTVKVPTR